jgi:hypothetical protein
MKSELQQMSDTLMAAEKLHILGDWKPGDPYMDKDLGGIRFGAWCGEFNKQIKEICNKCPCQLSHGSIWLDEQHSEGIPANKICVRYRQIESCYDAFQVAKTCTFIDKNKFGVYIKEMELYRKMYA